MQPLPASDPPAGSAACGAATQHRRTTMRNRLSPMLAALGAALGLILGHLMTEVLGAWLPASQRIHVTGRMFVPGELTLILLALAVGLVSALLPAVLAYRTDISRVLAQR